MKRKRVYCYHGCGRYIYIEGGGGSFACGGNLHDHEHN